MVDVVIETRGLSRRFGQSIAANDLNLAICRGEVFGFLGPNGAGKTTTVRLLNGVLAPSAGTVRVCGFDPIAQGAEVRRRAGVLTETPALYEQLTARDNLLIFGRLYGVPEERLGSRVDEVLQMFGLLERAGDKAGAYSRGMKQRLAIARALVHQPEILYLDEPTAGLDPAAARQVTEYIEELSRQEGRTVFLCTHNLLEAQRLCNRVGVINRGRLIAVGSPDELSAQLWQGHWVDVELGERPAEALLARLRGLAGVRDVTREERRVAVSLESPEGTPALVAELVAAGERVYQVTPRQHTLEDIYFELQEGQPATGVAA